MKDTPDKKADDPRSSPVLVCMADVQPERVQWLWPGRIPLGKITTLAGDPGLGKSFITIDLAARISNGSPWPDDLASHAPTGGAVLLTAEDDLADTVRPRLDAAGADVRRIMAMQATEYRDYDDRSKRERVRQRPFNLALDLPSLEQAIVQTSDCRLVVIDPISAYLPGIDSHKNAEVRSVLAPLAEVAAKHDVAVVAVTHLRKGEGAAMYRAMGSLAFVAAARAVFAVAKDKSDPARRLMVPIKCNLAADTNGLAYTLMASDVPDVPMVAWSADPVTVTADDVLGTDRDNQGAQDEAKDWLRNVLSDAPRPAKAVKSRARKDGLAPRTLDRAKAALGVIAYREGFGSKGKWLWRLPDANCAKSAGDNTLAHKGDIGALWTDGGDAEPLDSRPDRAKDAKDPKERQCTDTEDAGADWSEV